MNSHSGIPKVGAYFQSLFHVQMNSDLQLPISKEPESQREQDLQKFKLK